MIKKRRNNFAFWLARITSLAFVVLTFILAAPDIKILLQNYPMIMNFLVGTIILGLIIASWGNSRLAGIIFVIVSPIYYLVNSHIFLIVTVASTSFWFFLVGVLYFLSDYKKRRRKRTPLGLKTSLKTLVKAGSAPAPRPVHVYAHAVNGKRTNK